MKNFLLYIILLPAVITVFPQGKNHTAPLSSIEIAANFFKLHPDSVIYPDELKSRKWNYEQGLMLETFFRLYESTRKHVYTDYVKKNLDYYIEDNGNIKTYKFEDFNLDNIASGRAILELYKLTKNVKYKKAADLLREQLTKTTQDK